MVWKTRPALLLLVAASALGAGLPVVAVGGSPSKANATPFGPNVFVFDPTMPPADAMRQTLVEFGGAGPQGGGPSGAAVDSLRGRLGRTLRPRPGPTRADEPGRGP